MKQIKNNFIFFGAVHQDFVFELKNHLIKFRTNPVKHYESYGGVAHNVAKVIACKEKVSLVSINSDIETINYLKKNNINFFSFNKKIQKRYYAVSKIVTTEAGILHQLKQDIYLIIGENNTDYWSVKIYQNPLVSFIWIGIFISFIGGLISLKR